jgi:fructokinase
MIATFGEALVDLIEQSDGRFVACLGGSVCNFTQALAMQDEPTTYLNPLSHDKFGTQFSELLISRGVVLASSTRSTCPTSIAIVTLDERGSPTYVFHRELVADRDLTAAALIASLPVSCTLLHTGGLALVPADLAKVLATVGAAAKNGTLISIDANLRPTAVMQTAEYIAGVKLVLKRAHIVKVSDEDLEVLGMGDLSLDAAAATLFEGSDIQMIALTRGAAGATLITRSYAATSATPEKLTVVDTVGAGDCFHAGLIAYLEHNGKLASVNSLKKLDQFFLQAALQHAIAAASINITRSGCAPSTWEQAVAFNESQLAISQ